MNFNLILGSPYELRLFKEPVYHNNNQLVSDHNFKKSVTEQLRKNYLESFSRNPLKPRIDRKEQKYKE